MLIDHKPDDALFGINFPNFGKIVVDAVLKDRADIVALNNQGNSLLIENMMKNREDETQTVETDVVQDNTDYPHACKIFGLL